MMDAALPGEPKPPERAAEPGPGHAVDVERERLLRGLVACARLAKARGRTDLLGRLEASRERLADPATHVLVVGEFKQGKSTLINALLGAAICPVDDDVATSVPTAVRFSAQPHATALGETQGDGRPTPQELPFDSLAEVASERGNPSNERRIRLVEVGYPRDLLKAGLVLVDTPGVGGLGSVHGAITIGALPMAHAVILVSDASQEYTESELEFLRTALELCPNVVCVITKTDLYPEWRRIVEIDREHLRRAGVDTEVLPVSSTLRLRALKQNDASTNDESGFPALLATLQRRVLADARGLAIRGAVHDELSVIDQVTAALQAERSALADPADAARLIAELQETKGRAERLRAQAARWQVTLSDGFGDLGADLDFDLRDRIRHVVREAEESIDRSDPGEMWEEFQGWLERRTAAEVAASYATMVQRVEDVAERVAALFEEEEVSAEIGRLVQAPSLGDIDVDTELHAKAKGVGATSMLALRGSYSSFSMFGMLGAQLGMAMINPLTVVVGLFSGSGALRAERLRQIESRRQQAKAATRRYTDEVTFQVGKDSRDLLRQLQRELRDRFQARAEEVMRTAAESLAAAQSAVHTDEGDRAKRIQVLQVQLQQAAALRSQVAALAPEVARARSSGAAA
jgi:GTPase SAR1 family protein